MNTNEFVTIVEGFRRGARPGRNLYLWCGTRDRLFKIVKGEPVSSVSALEICNSGPVQGMDEMRQALESGLARWLNETAQSAARYSIAVVFDLAVLACYSVGLQLIYQHHASDRRMTILCAEPSPMLTCALPPVLEYNPVAVEQFYKNLLTPDYIVEDENGADTN